MEILNTLLYNLGFLFERLNWLSIIDLALVTLVFFFVLSALRNTQAVMVLRGIILVIVLLGLLSSQEILPAFSWLVRVTLPALLLSVPVIFAPEIRYALERLGRTGSFFRSSNLRPVYSTLEAVVLSAGRLSRLKHGALIVLQRQDDLSRYIKTGVILDAQITPELLLQIFYPNTPLHDGGVILRGNRVVAASCVMPLSTSNALTPLPLIKWGYATALPWVHQKPVMPLLWWSLKKPATSPSSTMVVSLVDWIPSDCGTSCKPFFLKKRPQPVLENGESGCFRHYSILAAERRTHEYDFPSPLVGAEFEHPIAIFFAGCFSMDFRRHSN